MTAPTTPAPRRGWWWIGVAVFAFVIAADLPVAQTLLPVHRELILLLPMVTSCALVGWWRGGNLSAAVVSIAATAWMMASVVRAGVSSDMLTAGWSVMAASCFGTAMLASRSKWFLGKGVVATLGALLAAVVVVAAAPSGTSALSATMDAVLEVRGNADLNNWRVARSQMLRSSAPQQADTATLEMLDRFEAQVATLPQVARGVLPSMLALQTLAAMALAWALFHRFSRTRLGEPIGRLREFRFNDHWIWSVIVGLTLTLLPALEGLRPLGVNLLVFFGALYAIRGAGVLAFFLRPGRSLLGLLVGVALLLLLRDGAAIALGLVGLGDTWADWRRRIRPAVS
jgi:hypothetical protein